MPPTDRSILGTRFVRAVGWTLVVLGVFVFVVGWVAGVDLVTRLGPGLASMKVNTAIGIALLGGLLLLAAHRPAAGGMPGHRWATVLAVAVALLGALTIIEYAAGADLRIDNLLVQDVEAGARFPGRMGLNTAISFMLAGTAWLLLARDDAPVARHRGGHVLLLASALLPLIALAGYGLQVQSVRGIGSATEMAVHTSVALVLATVAGFVATSWRGLSSLLWRDDEGGRTVRTVLGPATAAIIGIGLLSESAERLGIVDGVSLQLALSTVLTLLVVGWIVLAAGQRLSREGDAREAAELDRRRALSDLSAVTSAFGDVHVRLGPDLRILGIQGRHLDSSGMQLRGAPLGDLLPHDAVDRCVEAVEGLEQVGTVRTIAFEQPAPSGYLHGPAVFEGRVRRLDDGDLGLVIRDVSELEAARHELQQLAADLEERVEERTKDLASTVAELTTSNEDLSQFAFAASHDLREPLRMVTAYAHRLDARYEDALDERGRTYLRYVLQGAERMRILIDALLAYSRVGQQDLHLSDVPLSDVVAAAIRALPADLDATTVEVASDLGRLRCDPDLLGLAVRHLISNALIHGREDVPHVRVRSTAEPGWTSVLIEDDGAGIPEGHRVRVQQLFQRLQLREEIDTAGAGLAIARRIVERHGGTLQLSDSELGGTCATLRLPAAV